MTTATITTDTTLDIATAPKRNSSAWEQDTVTWGEFCSWVDNPADRKESGNYLFGRLKGKRRRSSDVLSRSAVTLDADSPCEDFLARVEDRLGKYAHVWHTTHSSTPENPRYRIVIPLAGDVEPGDYAVIADQLMTDIDRESFDLGGREPVRYMFRPAEGVEGSYHHGGNRAGVLLPGGEIVESFTGDMSSLPTPSPGPTKRDPFSLQGAAGAFNRVYDDLPSLISEYDLPYEPSGGDRWHLRGAGAAAGMGQVRHGLFYSHHRNDPAYGAMCTAFDLVRMHRFLELDSADDRKKPVNRRPSHEAMLELAAKDPRVVEELVGSDFVADLHDIEDDVAADPDAPVDSLGNGGDDSSSPASKPGTSRGWTGQLEISPRSGEVKDSIFNWELIRDNDPVMAGLQLNELTASVETDGDLPWRTVTEQTRTFTGTDRVELRFYIDRTYSLRLDRRIVDDLVDTRAAGARFNPVKDWLLSLEWDGVPRMEEALPGVRPTDYTRLVARKCLAAAAGRMLDPGVKWDHVLTLYGAQGLGKSWWIHKMARGFDGPLGRVSSKDTLITMQRSWIVTSDEGATLQSSEFDDVKEFLTRTEDTFRMPYDREATTRPRHNVIWATTNDPSFLGDGQEGNRRFLIVECTDSVDFDSLTDEYIDQVWAEAVHTYQAGEPLFFPREQMSSITQEQDIYTDEDDLRGLVEQYLETPVPDDWDDVPLYKRVEYLQNVEDGMVAPGGNRIEHVSAIQLWVEAMGRNRGDHSRADLIRLGRIIASLPGWVKLHGRRRVRAYGPQQMYQRVDDII